MKIPSIIHLIFLRKTEPFPALFNRCEMRIRAIHPSWNVRRIDEDYALCFLQEYLPEYIGAYGQFKHNVQRADFLRLALVYVFGGFYMDLDMLALTPLDDLRSHSLVLGEEKTVSQEEKARLGLKHDKRIANYMFGAEPRHPFMKCVMERMMEFSTVPIHSQQELLDTTGPGLLTDMYWDNVDKFQDITLLENRERWCLVPGHHEISCHFGDYAAHLHAGTWRKEFNK